MLSRDFKEFIQLLVERKVEFLIVGGYAVGVHGYPRFTGDLDVWIKISEANASRVLAAIHDFGFSSLSLTKLDFLTIDNVIQLGHPPFRIDILTSLDGVSFDECYSRKHVVDIEGLPVSFIGLQDLLVNKNASGRLRDLDDIENLK
jgi:predicted nucleotidyltransferase